MRTVLVTTATALLAILAGCDNPFASQPANTSKEQTSTAPAASSVTLSAPAASVAAPVPVTVIAAPTAPLRPAGTTLDAPDEQAVAMLYYSFAPPAPIKEWVDADMRYSSANEFERETQRKKLEGQLQRALDEAAKVGRLILHVSANLSEYDTEYGQYYIDLFASSSFMSYNYRGKFYRIEFVNKEDAHGWKLSADEAARVLDRNQGSRSISVTVTLDVVGHSERSGGGALQTKAVNYTIETGNGNVRLGQVAVARPGPAKP